MPCPYFEPLRVTPVPTHSNARLPLIDEYEGTCRALPEPVPVSAETRLRLCNHGNARGQCPSFPIDDQRSAYRFSVLQRSPAALDVLLIDEALYEPKAWTRCTFSIDTEHIEPPPADICRQAQTLAFCRSYLRRFPS